MKKTLLLMTLGAFAAMSMTAQEIEDYTQYIANPGFDEDLTFQIDGTMKPAVVTDHSLSDRSWAYISEDSTLYARPKSDSSKNRPDGRKLEAVNGFIGRIKGWTVESSAAFPGCEWVYFGNVPYGLGAEAVPTSDDTNGFLYMPEVPTEFGDETNVAAAYMRAGWGGWVIYKQEVLPVLTAQYDKYEVEQALTRFDAMETKGVLKRRDLLNNYGKYSQEIREMLEKHKRTFEQLRWATQGSDSEAYKDFQKAFKKLGYHKTYEKGQKNATTPTIPYLDEVMSDIQMLMRQGFNSQYQYNNVLNMLY